MYPATDSQAGKLSMKYHAILVTLTLCGLLAACGKDSNVTIIGDEGGYLKSNIGLSNGQVILHAHDAPDAIISANGDLQIDRQPITINQDERQLLKSYYDNATMITADGIATGKAGAAVGAQALKSVATRLADGNPDQIKQDVEAKAQAVKDAALKICRDLGNIKTNQDQLAAQLPAFKPYANVISADSVNDCEKDQKD